MSPGHSGTDQKHRRAFDKAKTYYQNTNKKGVRTSFSYDKGEQKKKIALTNKSNLYVRLPLLMVLFFSIYYIIAQSGFLLNQHATETQEIAKQTQKKDAKDAYTYFTYDGNRYLQAGMYDEAEIQFKKALNLDVLNKQEASAGYEKTMIRKHDLMNTSNSDDVVYSENVLFEY